MTALITKSERKAAAIIQLLARAVHDSLDWMCPESERKAAARLIGRFVHKVDFGKDVEAHLNFLVDCRRAFFRAESVQWTVAERSSAPSPSRCNPNLNPNPNPNPNPNLTLTLALTRSDGRRGASQLLSGLP
eukprot:1185566-Prorocentrum_minimum.AAC.2